MIAGGDQRHVDQQPHLLPASAKPPGSRQLYIGGRWTPSSSPGVDGLHWRRGSRQTKWAMYLNCFDLHPGVGERRCVAEVGERERVDRVDRRADGRSLAFFRHAPIGDSTTPGAISSLTCASATNWPRSLNTRTYCPSAMPRSVGVLRVDDHRLLALHPPLCWLVARAGVEVGVRLGRDQVEPVTGVGGLAGRDVVRQRIDHAAGLELVRALAEQRHHEVARGLRRPTSGTRSCPTASGSRPRRAGRTRPGRGRFSRAQPGLAQRVDA